jgi:protein-S-isoprenylcysteine O-methyltransferase Ste14
MVPAGVMVVSRPSGWIAAWIATGLVISQIVLLILLGAGDLAYLRYVGFAIWALAALFGWLPIWQFKKSGGVAKGAAYVETTRLVDTGLYAIVRHPQFVAWPLMCAAVALVSQHPAVIGLGAVGFVFSCVGFRAADEQGIEKFGDEYRAYMERVPGWNFLAGFWRWARRRAGTPAAE